MHMTFRWYGVDDPVPLEYIRQIPGVAGIVSALYDVPVGDVWTGEDVQALRDRVQAAGLQLSVIESIPVHEDIKLGRGDRDRLIEQYGESLHAVGAAGVPVVCYNFMPVFDWLRTDLAMRLDDASTALSFSREQMAAIDFSRGTGELPGWATAYSGEELAELRAAYESTDDEQLWDNLGYFLERIVPEAQSAGVKLALHPDDPPWPVAGFPRIITSGDAFMRVIQLVDNPVNGVTLCTGSLGAKPDEAGRLPETARRLGELGRIHFVHGRNVITTGEEAFHEAEHPYGDVDLPAVLHALKETGFDGPIRPDHGRMIWGERGRAGYGLYDRALGATYLLGVWHGLAWRPHSELGVPRSESS